LPGGAAAPTRWPATAAIRKVDLVQLRIAKRLYRLRAARVQLACTGFSPRWLAAGLLVRWLHRPLQLPSGSGWRVATRLLRSNT
jgi:hypothetical protein